MSDLAASHLLFALHPGNASGDRTDVLASLDEAAWNDVLSLAGRVNILPLLDRRLRSCAGLPTPISLQLRTAYLQTAAANLRLYLELERTLATLANAGVEVILLKGCAVAQEVYRNIALRPMTDIDLLVRRENLAAAVATLKNLGYAAPSDEPPAEQLQRHHHLEPFAAPDKFSIELHCHIEPPDSAFTIDIEELWRQQKPIKIGRQPAMMLSPEQMLLHLCIHAARHACTAWGDRFAIKSVCDIAELINAVPLDWNTVTTTAREWKCERATRVMLSLASDWLAAPVPAAIVKSLDANPAAIDLTHWAQRQLFPAITTLPMGPHTARLLTPMPITQRARVILRRLFPPAAEVRRRFKLPRRSLTLPFYYLLRLQQLAARDTRTVWAAWRGKDRTLSLVNNAARTREVRTWLLAEKP